MVGLQGLRAHGEVLVCKSDDGQRRGQRYTNEMVIEGLGQALHASPHGWLAGWHTPTHPYQPTAKQSVTASRACLRLLLD